MLQHLCEAHRAPAIEQDVPRIDRPGHGTCEQPVASWQFTFVVLLVPLDRRQLRRRAFRIDRDDLLRAGVVEQEHGVTADTIHRGVDHTQHGLTGNDGVESVAPCFKNSLRRSRRFGFHRRYREMPAAHDRTHRPSCAVSF